MKHFKYVVLLLTLFSTTVLKSTAQNSPDSSQVVNQNLSTLKIKVTGITCSGDCKDIQKSVAQLNGVSATKQISKPAATTIFEIVYDPSLVTEKQIRKSVEDVPGCDDPDKRPYKAKKADK
jgi:copper chaperone CopZ